MGTARTPAGTRIYMQSAIAAAQAVSSITAANPGVITYAGADPANGNYVALTDVYGMTELEDALVKVANVNTTANTFEAQSQNTTGYGTFTAGNMKVVTLGTEILDATGITLSGFDQQFAEFNLLRDRITRKLPTNVSSGSIELTMLWDPSAADAAALRVAADTAQKMAFKVLFPDGLEMLFFGYVGASGLPRIDNNAVITTTVSLSIATRPRYVLV